MNRTRIGWCDYSSNPVAFRRKSDGKRGWHCVKISAGCAHCYSEAIDGRFGMQLPFTQRSSAEVEPFLVQKELDALGKVPAGSKVFLFDMTDLFLDEIPWSMLDQVFGRIAYHRRVIFQILTKRIEKAHAYFKRKNHWGAAAVYRDLVYGPDSGVGVGDGLSHWPPQNVWLGVSCEDQKAADERIPLLLQIPAAVRFVSAEPLLGPIDFERSRYGMQCNWLTGEEWSPALARGGDRSKALSWVIVGGESGPKRRECEVEWIASIADQCRAANVPVFVKQDSGPRDGMQGRIPDDLWSLKQFPGDAPCTA